MNDSERWLEQNLVCPYDGQSLSWAATAAACPGGHRLPVVHGIPVALRNDIAPTHHLWRTTAADIDRLAADAAAAIAPEPGVVEPFVEKWLVGMCGNLYRGCATPLPRYPIPEPRLPDGQGGMFLDVGANWGRWSLAAARRGYRAIAIDPSLEAALAGARIARQLQLPVTFVVGDGRYLPFRDNCIDTTFSYSVLQHLDKEVVRTVLREMGRVTRLHGTVRVQVANVLGLKQLLNHADEWIRRTANLLAGRRRPPYGFRIRPWTPSELRRTISSILGPPSLTADGFFSLDAQPSDIDLLSPRRGLVVRAFQIALLLERTCASADEPRGQPHD